MPSGWPELAATLCCFAPGWIALTCWRIGRGTVGAERPLTDGIPAVALSAIWTGPLALLCAPALVDWWTAASSPVARATALLVVLAALLGTPGMLAYLIGRLMRPRAESEPITAWLVDGTIVHGLCDRQRSSETTLILIDAELLQGSARWASTCVEIARAQLIATARTPVLARPPAMPTSAPRPSTTRAP